MTRGSVRRIDTGKRLEVPTAFTDNPTVDTSPAGGVTP